MIQIETKENTKGPGIRGSCLHVGQKRAEKGTRSNVSSTISKTFDLVTTDGDH